MSGIDLHIHTTFSDGTLTPAEVVRVASEAGLSAIAIADHDEVGGIHPALEEVEKWDIEIVPAVEISSKMDDRRGVTSSVHILGYFIDLANPELLDLLSFICKARIERAEQIALSLQGMGFPIDIKEIKQISGPGVICRPHIASAMIKMGIVTDKKEAFEKYLSYHSPCYVPKINKPTPEVIKIISKAGGIPVLAHPSYIAEEQIKEFVDMGIRGIEVWYPSHSEQETNRYLELANLYNLVPTGGSDAHGSEEIGKFSVPDEVLQKLRNERFNF